jgi:hypothetical protein
MGESELNVVSMWQKEYYRRFLSIPAPGVYRLEKQPETFSTGPSLRGLQEISEVNAQQQKASRNAYAVQLSLVEKIGFWKAPGETRAGPSDHEDL